LAAGSISIRGDSSPGRFSLSVVQHGYFLAEVALIVILNEYFAVVALSDA